MKPFLLHMPPELLDRLKRTADRNQVSVAHLVRLIVSEWFESKDAKQSEGQRISQ
jgi:hypothetical protein